MRTNRKLLSITGFLIVLALAGVLGGTARNVVAQGGASIRLDYTTHNTEVGEITAKKTSVAYTFAGSEGDVITIGMIRSSGNLRPLIGLFDFQQPKGKELITASSISDDGAVAGIVKFALPSTGDYVILATREGAAKGTTTGKYLITLLLSGGDQEPTATKKSSAKPSATPKKSKATPTPSDEEPTPEATEEATVSSSTDTGSTEAVQSFKVGKAPVFSVWSGDNLFVANSGDGSVSVLDGDGNKVSTIKVGGVPFAMAWDGKRLWVADLGTDAKPGDSVNVFDAKGKKAGTFKVGAQPFSLSYDADNKRMWIALYGENKIVSVDPKGEILSSIDTDTNPNTVLWTGDVLWATLAGTQDKPGNQVLAIDTDSNITGTFKVGKSPADLAWNADDQILYVANYDDNNVMALGVDGKVKGTYKVGKGPGALAWDGTHLWVSLGGDSAVVALSNKGKVLAKVPVSPAPNGITFDGTHIWAANQGPSDKPGSTVTRIDVAGALGEQ
jgi:YVTN family beta-propeller protein